MEALKIFTEQLKNDHRQAIEVSLPPAFLDLQENDVQTPSSSEVKGEVYIMDDLLMFSLSVKTFIHIPCSICNKLTEVTLENENIFISLPLVEIPSSVFDCSELIREEILMLIPQFVECKKGACPARAELKPFLKKEEPNFPFADLR